MVFDTSSFRTCCFSWHSCRRNFRVLKNNGLVYSEIPFMQQIHMGKNDFVRYTASGHRFLFKKFEKIKIGTSGPEPFPGQ